MYSKFLNYLRFNSQHHKWGYRLDDHSRAKIFTFDIEQDIHMSSQNYQKNGYIFDTALLIICYQHTILQ